MTCNDLEIFEKKINPSTAYPNIQYERLNIFYSQVLEFSPMFLGITQSGTYFLLAHSHIHS